MNVLVLNLGSSSLKFQVIASDLERIREHKDERICRGEVEGIGGETIIRINHRIFCPVKHPIIRHVAPHLDPRIVREYA